MFLDILGFIFAFLFSLSCVFSIVAKLYNVDEIFNTTVKTMKLLIFSSIISLIISGIYWSIVNRIF